MRGKLSRQRCVCVCLCLCLGLGLGLGLCVCVSCVYSSVSHTDELPPDAAVSCVYTPNLCLVYTHPTPLPSRTQMSYDEMLREHERLRSVVEAIATSEKAKAALLKVLRHAIVTRALLPYK